MMRVLPEEYDKVFTMQVIDREVFFYLCQRTDHKTGTVGQRLRVSRSGIALDISERMVPGKRSKCWVVSASDVKHAIERLVLAGLLNRLSKAEKGIDLVLERVFFVQYLQTHKSVKKQVDRPVDRKLSGYNQETNNNISELEENKPTAYPEVDRQVDRTIYINTSTTTDAEKPFALSIDWQPTESELRAILFRSVGSKHKIEDIDPRWLGEFVGYWFSMPGRMMTQRQWTAKYSANVIRYFSDPDLVARKFGGGVSGVTVGRQAAFDAGARNVPDFARLPKSDEELISFAKRFAYGDPDPGDGWIEFRSKLKLKINRRLAELNLPKVSW